MDFAILFSFIIFFLEIIIIFFAKAFFIKLLMKII